MKRASFLVMTGLAGMLTFPAAGVSQTPAPSHQMAPATGMKPDRTTAPLGMREKMQSKQAALKQKRTECRIKARAEKVPLLQRPAYVKKCRAEAN